MGITSIRGSIEVPYLCFKSVSLRSAMIHKLLVFFLIFCFLIGTSCSDSEHKKGKALFDTHCANCHSAPDIQDLPKFLWKGKVLPEMGARMGVRDSAYDPYEGYTFEEQYAMIQSGVYTVTPAISKEDWQRLVDYVVSNAPDSLPHLDVPRTTKSITQFSVIPVDIDSTAGSLITYAEFDSENDILVTADIRGNVFGYNAVERKLTKRYALGNPVTAFDETDTTAYIATVGILDPSEISLGSVTIAHNGSGLRLPFEFHRPVHILAHDFNGNGDTEIVVSEFGNLTGQVSLLVKTKDSVFEKRTLLNRPGAVRAIARDMDGNGKDDIVVMTAQGDEGISILYQSGDLDFKSEQPIRFSPLYGSSWFELLDYDGDGDQDILTVHGDNGDKTKILKPYHGVRIHLNDGSNHFSEAFFYPFYGATRSVSRDFDQDGDIDIALISTFPDYGSRPVQSFVFLENTNSSKFSFEPLGLPKGLSGRWFLMDAGDVDSDGDEDLILTCFTYSFTPLPRDLARTWQKSDFDVVILENRLLD
ncbi:MAG TPA: FG-GAP-like repeat-containing protein [Pricia sp.]|nr:FG-GAP-like repeat-containing protein [Pricia sp.]